MLLALPVGLAAVPGLASAQVQAGGEVRVNTYTTGFQYAPAIAAERDGDVTIVWNSLGQDGSDFGVFGQRYDASGAPRGLEFRVNSNTIDRQFSTPVALPAAAWPDGRFVVLWSSTGQDGSGVGVFGQRFAADGSAAGSEFQVNSYTIGDQRYPSVALARDGGFVVVWHGDGQDGSNRGVFGQRFDGAANRVGSEFQANTYTTGHQFYPLIASDASGNFVVVWNGSDPSSTDVLGQRFDSFGSRIGGEFQLNTYTPGSQYLTGLARTADGRFMVGWDSPGDGSGDGVFVRRFDAVGNPLGAEFIANEFTTGAQFFPHLAADAVGNFVVTWTDYTRDGSARGQFARRFNAAGVARGADFPVNTYTTGQQWFGVVGSDAVGNFVVSWFSSGQDGSGYAVMAQRFGGLFPTALSVDTTGNAVWEPGETVDVRPTWRNLNGAAQTFGGALTSLTGPAGAAYTLVDGTADYGTVANGASAGCADCYSVGVNNPTPRPVQHWDAFAPESITPDTQGQQKRWPLHIGQSFADVPNTNGFYAFIETLLHFGVTGGCSATDYCPGTVTTREQMAVFVLVAKEGAGYLPAACTTPIFTDVPAASPFCGFIEELVRRGVVSGCNASPPQYCPTAPVTREQMAVFVLRTLDPTLDPPNCVPPNLFADVPETSAFCRWIEELANRGVVSGCGGGNYCPTQPVTREQMGVFIAVTFGLTLYGP